MQHVEGMLGRDLGDAGMLEESVTRLIDELFDILHEHPNYARLFIRQLLVTDLDLRNVEDDTIVPTLRVWSERIESQIDTKRLGTMNLFLFFLSASLMYWGLFVQPKFIARYFRIDPDSDTYLSILKGHAREMTLRMIEERRPRLTLTRARYIVPPASDYPIETVSVRRESRTFLITRFGNRRKTAQLMSPRSRFTTKKSLTEPTAITAFSNGVV